MTTSLTTTYEAAGMLPPAVKIAMASDWATCLMDVVERRKLYQTIHEKRYLQVEAWELVGAFDECTASTRFEPIDQGGETIGYRGIATLMRHGETVGGAEASCYLDASVTHGRTGHNADRAAQSAAQTWAVSKAFRQKYSYVAVLAGFEPTPAEEMALESAPAEGRRGATLPKPRLAAPPAPPSRPTFLDELREVSRQLGWTDDELRTWLDTNGFRVNGRVQSLALPALRALLQDRTNAELDREGIDPEHEAAMADRP